MNHNPTIAKLLAKENVTVQHGNYHTAWFDIKNRVLGLPIWKDMGKDVYDLLVGHEIGHALYTPFEGWHDSPEKLEGCPRSYINVIEDARIEKFVRSDYPGLIRPMANGYKILLETGFFSDVDNINWNEVKLIDKINLKAKLQNLIEVPFNSEEQVYFDRAFTTITFDEVVELCRDILAYTQENQPELLTPPPASDDDQDLGNNENDDLPRGHDDVQAPGEDNETTNEKDSESRNENSEENSEDSDENSTSSEAEESAKDKDIPAGDTDKQKQTPDADESLTDNFYRNAERDLIDLDEDGSQTLYVNGPSKEIINDVVVPYKKLAEYRERMRTKRFAFPEYEEKGDFAAQYEIVKKMYTQKMKDVKVSIRPAVKEFEQRKAAQRWQKASTAKTGMLNVNKLHAYKTDDDIFLRATKLADSKNHGMMMMIDYSGSMYTTLGHVLDQLIHLVAFCKAVQIPFEVYGFTSVNTRAKYIRDMHIDGDISMADCCLPQLISSDLNKTDYTEALFQLYLRHVCMTDLKNYGEDDENGLSWRFKMAHDDFMATSEKLGSTPLNQALVLAHTLIKKFKAKNAVEKMNFVVLSDGDSNRLTKESTMDHELYTESNWYGSRNVIAIIEKKKVVLKDLGRRGTKDLLASLQKRYGCTTLGFFVSSDNHDWRSKVGEVNNNDYRYGSDFYKDASNMYRKDKVAHYQNVLGYDEFYLVKGQKLATQSDTQMDNLGNDASKGQIGAAFKKKAKSKKANKVLLTKFGIAVA